MLPSSSKSSRSNGNSSARVSGRRLGVLIACLGIAAFGVGCERDGVDVPPDEPGVEVDGEDVDVNVPGVRVRVRDDKADVDID